jgi:hypothetical protein
MNQIIRTTPGVTVLPPEHRNDSGLVRPDALYTLRDAAAFVRVPQPALRELLDRAGVSPITLKGRDYVHGANILDALKVTR